MSSASTRTVPSVSMRHSLPTLARTVSFPSGMVTLQVKPPVCSSISHSSAARLSPSASSACVPRRMRSSSAMGLTLSATSLPGSARSGSSYAYSPLSSHMTPEGSTMGAAGANAADTLTAPAGITKRYLPPISQSSGTLSPAPSVTASVPSPSAYSAPGCTQRVRISPSAA